MSNTFHRQQPISHSFYAYGLDGIGTHRADERRATPRHRGSEPVDSTGPLDIARRKLGSLLITAGERTLGEPVGRTAPAS